MALGFTFAAGVIFFVALGYGLDRWLGLMPLFTITGTVLGAGLSFLVVYRRLMAEQAARKAEQADREAG